MAVLDNYDLWADFLARLADSRRVIIPCRYEEEARALRDRFYTVRKALRRGLGDPQTQLRAEQVAVVLEDAEVIFEYRHLRPSDLRNPDSLILEALQDARKKAAS